MNYLSRLRHLKLGWLIPPLLLFWKLIGAVVALTGRKLAMVIGVVLVVLGFAFSLTIIGAVIGIPMMLIGVILLVRALTARR